MKRGKMKNKRDIEFIYYAKFSDGQGIIFYELLIIENKVGCYEIKNST